MAIITGFYYAYCDNEECPLHWERALESEYRTKKEIIEAMKAGGWLFRKGKHYCPNCAADQGDLTEET